MDRTKNLTVLFLAAAVFGGASCQNTANSNTASNSADNKTVTANTAPAPAVDNTSTAGAGTPTAAYMAAYAARKNADVPALKKLFSKSLLEFFSEISGQGEKK
ncbi:hypothetical protein BH20ACI2_BH20ACI2_09360 [soil metagenome]